LERHEDPQKSSAAFFSSVKTVTAAGDFFDQVDDAIAEPHSLSYQLMSLKKFLSARSPNGVEIEERCRG